MSSDSIGLIKEEGSGAPSAPKDTTCRVNSARWRSRRLAVEVKGIHQVTPARFSTGETWFEVATVLGPSALKRAVDRLTPPTGWRWRTQVVRPTGYLDLITQLTEEP